MRTVSFLKKKSQIWADSMLQKITESKLTFSVAVQEKRTAPWEREHIACNVVVLLL
jgi:hypothetical protein